MSGTIRRTWTRGLLLAAGWVFLTGAVVVPLAWAATTWGTITGPSFNGSNWVTSGTVTLSGSDKTPCFEYDTPNDPLATLLCVCPTCNPPVTNAPFTCTLPGASVANEPGAINWQLVTYTGNGTCTGSREPGTPVRSGTFAPNGTGPLAVSLASLGASSGDAWALPLGLAGLGAAAFVLARRRRHSEGASAS